jgi:hypothetical protein
LLRYGLENVGLRGIRPSFSSSLGITGVVTGAAAGVVVGVSEVSEETRRGLLVFCLLENVGRTISPDHLTALPDRSFNPQAEFQAYYNAIWGDVAPVMRLRSEFVRCGAYNELYWVSSPTAKSGPGPTLVKAVVPTVEQIETSGTRLPPSPDIRALLESHWQKGDSDFLRLIDIVSHSYGGVSKIDEPLPVGASLAGFIGTHGQTVALSPAILAPTKQYIDIIKSEKMENHRRLVENALVTTARKGGADATLGVLWTGMGEVLWKLGLFKAPPLYICLSPWLTSFGQSPGLSRIGLHEKPHVLFVIPYQSRPSLLTTLERYSGFSPSDTRWEKSLGLLTNPEKPHEFQVLLGQRHPLLDQILEALGGSPPPPIVPPMPPAGSGAGIKVVVTPKPQLPPLPQLEPHEKESILIGYVRGTKEPVVWEPGKGTGVLQPNRNVLIVGAPGTGKSQLIKAFVWELRRVAVPSIALDWVSEYADVLPNAIDAKKGVTINPLELPSGAAPYQTALEIASIIGAVFSSLGDIQVAMLRDAVLKAYKKMGILQELPGTWKISPPTFEDVVDMVQLDAAAGTQKTAAQGLLSRISPFVVLKLFSGSTTIPFEQLVSGGSSILLGSLYTDDLRMVFGHFFLNKLWYYVQNLGATSGARFYLVLDEANRLAFPDSPLERLVREARKFGVGIIVASQRPGDFTDTVPANAACTIVFRCPLERDAAFMAKQLNCRPADIQGLGPTFDALVRFDYEGETRRVSVIPYYQRVEA